MKLNFKSLSIVLLVIICESCGNDDLNCNSNLAKATVLEILEDSQQEKMDLAVKWDKSMADMADYPKRFFSNYVDIKHVITTAKNKELKSCECEAVLYFKLSPELKEYIDNNANDKYFNSSFITKALEQEYDIEYQLNETDDGETLARTYDLEEIPSVMAMFYGIEKQVSEIKKNEKEQKSYTSQESELNEDNTSKNSNKNYYYPNSDKDYDMCFRKIESEDENGQSITWLQLKENKNSNRIIGDFGFYPHYDMDSWNGKISAKKTEKGIEGSYIYSSEGMEYIEPFIITIDNNKATYELSEGVYYLDGEPKKAEDKTIILEKVECK